MTRHKISGPALFMYSVIVVCAVTAAACLGLYYTHATESPAILWAGIVAFMIVYHFWGRILLGNITKLFRFDPSHWWFREKPFEKKLYRLLAVKRWKGKALTYDPEAFSLSAHTLDEIAAAMTKAETDHWLNEGISLLSILFALLWGYTWLFAATAVLAMLFDAQFIVIQRFNRPRILRILARRNTKVPTAAGRLAAQT